MNRSLLTNSQATVGKSNAMTAPQSNRNSTLIQSGKGLMAEAHGLIKKPTDPGMTPDRNSTLRQSANSQIGGNKYAYHKSKPAETNERAGQYVTKEARLQQAQQVKASHFQLGYMGSNKDNNKAIQDEIDRQKWNPKAALAKKDLAKSNFSLGTSNTFNGLSQNQNDFQNHGSTQFDPNAKAKRLELVNQLRKSNLPSQHYEFPKSTAQESFAQAKGQTTDIDAIRQRKEDANKIFAKNRGAKPNFTLGGHKLDYQSENRGSLKEPSYMTYDKATMEAQVATQRKHNFKMSYDKANIVETAKGSASATPYKLPAENAHKDRVAAKGSSNLHQVQIGNNRHKNDYKSLTAMQQDGHAPDKTSRNGMQANYTEVRDKIAQQTKDLRSSHFNLGGDNGVAQASSAAMYKAPPTNALLSGTKESQEARERIQRSNFTIKDAHGGRQGFTTQNQANNQIRQGQWDQGQITKATAVMKPGDNINFGQSRVYSTEAKSTFIGSDVRGFAGDPMRLKEKFTKPNINFGTSPNKDQMMTVAQANDKAVSQQIVGGSINLLNKDQNAKSKEFGLQMRAANFKMGSILPEHNQYRATQLETQKNIGLTSNFRPKNNQPVNSQKVSSGNNIAQGHGSFKTVNQEFTGWIQPSAVAT